MAKTVAAAGGALTIVRDADLLVTLGDSVAIVGASGSGKTTLLGLLAGLDSSTAGSVKLAGTAIEPLDENGRAALRARHAGFVFQDFKLLPALTALDNVMLPLELAGQRDAAPRAQAELDAVGLGDRLKSYPRQLSGGEQQRVALARAFVTRPALLFADEPTGSLDAATGKRVIDLLFDLNASHGTTLVLVTHDPALAARCQRVFRMTQGELVEETRAAADAHAA